MIRGGMRALALKVFFMIYAAVAVVVLVASIEINEYFPHERDALLQLRDRFINSSSNLHANWTGPPCYMNQSRWAGIACWDWHVTHLVLDGIQLSGSLPQHAFLQNITFLSKLSLRNNSLYGPLPNLTNLLYLQLLLLSHNRFSGSIPSEYIELPRLTKLELQENSLDGSIPPFHQPTLTGFNVSYNHLEGAIPATQILERFPKSSFDHNSDLCGQPLGIPCPSISPPSPPPSIPSNKEKTKGTVLEVWSIALIAAAAALIPLTVMLVFLCYYWKRRRRVNRKEAQGYRDHPAGSSSVGWRAEKKTYWSESMEDPDRTVELEFFDKERRLVVFDLDELLRASAEIIGKGKLGNTYKAMLESGPVVAVKRLIGMNALSKKDFVQQMHLLGNMRHENLVDIISFYYSREEKLVIYEFVPNGNLFELLHGNRGVGRVPLNWTARLSIVKQIAKGLVFLHQSLPSHKVPHGNLKSSNVLIQRDRQNYHSKLTGFGFLPLLPSRRSSEKLAIAKSPEFSQGKRLTYKADIYCFGIILLEVITGKMPGEISRRGNEEGGTVDDVSDWVRTVFNSDWSTDILDVEIISAREEHDEMLRLTEIALECTDTKPEKRPKMSEVLSRIEEIEQVNKESAAES